MSDLMERLRENLISIWHGVEIERLRGERNIARIDLANMEMRLRHRDSEIEELRADLQQFRAWAEPQCDDYVRQKEEIERLRRWVDDLHSGMWINCVYCGHRYGPGESTPVSMAEVLKAHVEQCPQHPMSALRAERNKFQREYEKLCGFYTREGMEALLTEHWPDVAGAQQDANWIPVSEQLPQPHGHVWCLNRCGRQFEGAICYGMHAPFFTLPHGDGKRSNTVPAWIDVTHWRPLPEVPR